MEVEWEFYAVGWEVWDRVVVLGFVDLMYRG